MLIRERSFVEIARLIGARPIAFSALAAALVLAGCGNHDAGIPAACHSDDQQVRAALARAPAPVRLDGTPLSRCFAHAAGSADVQEVGALYVEVAQELADGARAKPRSAAATQLGYLVGVVRKAAGRGFGVYYEAHRRIEGELDGVDTRSPEFVAGERAGERTG